MNQPKILHVIPSLAIGGTERQLVQFIVRSGHPELHEVAVFDEAGSLACELLVPPCDVGPFGRSLRDVGTNLTAARRLRRLIRSIKPNLVHAHLGVAEVLTAGAVPRGFPLVASRRGIDERFQRSLVNHVIKGLAHRRVDLLLCNSRYLAEQTLRHDLWPPPVRVIYNAVDPEQFRPTPFPSYDEPTLAVVANFGKEKRHDLFLRALVAVRATLPTTRAILVGDGPERSNIVALVHRLGLEGTIDLTGSVSDVRPSIWRAHVVVLTSDNEGFPNSLLEGMSCGRPVVATKVGGIPEFVRDGQDGLLVSANPRAISDALVGLLTNRRRLESMGKNAAARAREFGWDRHLLEMNDVYGGLLERANRRARTK